MGPRARKARRVLGPALNKPWVLGDHTPAILPGTAGGGEPSSGDFAGRDMKSPLHIGETGELVFVVEAAHAVSFDPAMPPVLSTPSLLWFVEHAAIRAMQPHFDSGEVSVGVEVELQHLAATPVGVEVRCRARVVSVDGPVVAFQVEAHDGFEVVARCFHKRRVVRASGLARRVEAKRPHSGT